MYICRHRWTGRYEAHLWDKSTWNQTQNKKGKQVYLGAYDDEEAAARAYDLAALKYWGPGTTINFPVSDYARDIDDMQNVSREDYLASLRRRSSGFSRSSKAKGVCRSHTSIRWDSHIRGNFAGIPTINGYDSFGNGGLEYGILGCPQMGLINLCHFLNWLQPPSLSGDTHSNGSKRPLNLKHMEEDCLSEEQSSQRSTTGGEDYSDATCEQQQEKDKSSRPSWSCEPYQMPTLGIRRKSRSSMSALAALSQSVMFQKMEQGLRGWRVPEQAEMRVSETATTALAEALAMDGLAELEEIENSTALHQSHEATARRICDSVQSPQEVESTSCSMDLHNSTPNMRKSSTRAGQMASCSDDHSRGDNVNMHSLLPPAPYIIDQQAAYLSDQLPGLWNAFYAPSSIGMIF
ncbi:hypothetical protein KP509_14G085600 [Ceratopteris richardii]|uniref:AP2/ERF domain-containing protein n=1 Tax=Ceratopteris richardii TaxID=49495 RepID=A0A8T2T9X9_CERRI|nr:hypothetical protein KP509_14G085600 [Ceratopteris richardii]